MKYLLSFLLGVLLTSVFFVFYLKNRLVDNTPSVAATEQVEKITDPASGGLPGGFNEFYENFHRDSAFQLSHIHFPLEGIPERKTNEMDLNDFYWTREDWRLHRPFDAMDGAFDREFQPVGENMVIENIIHMEANYAMQRRFSRDGADEWNLIYYAAMNKLAVPE